MRKLIASTFTSLDGVMQAPGATTGVVMSTYVPAGDIPLGSLSQAEPSAKELTRRAKMATDAT